MSKKELGIIPRLRWVYTVIAAIISTWFFVKTCRRLSQEYFSKKDKNELLSFAEYLTAIEQWEDGE